MNRYLISIRILFLFLILLFISCEELEFDPDSIFEADSSEQIPLVNSINENINGSSATFSWTGNEYAQEFSYRLYPISLDGLANSGQQVSQSYFEWSDWTIETNKSFNALDEGTYTFYVKSRFNGVIEEVQPYKTRDIYINNILGPSLRIYPLNQIAQSGDEVNVYLYFEEVQQISAVTGLHVDIHINSAELEFITDSFEQGELITQFTGTTIYPTPSYSEGTISIDGVADANGSGIYGTGPITKFRLKVLGTGGIYNIIIGTDGSYLNINDEPIGFENPIGGSVTVEGAGQ